MVNFKGSLVQKFSIGFATGVCNKFVSWCVYTSDFTLRLRSRISLPRVSENAPGSLIYGFVIYGELTDFLVT
jgi:hypothetical protein